MTTGETMAAAAARLRAFTAGWAPPERRLVDEVIAELSARRPQPAPFAFLGDRRWKVTRKETDPWTAHYLRPMP